MRIGDTFKKAAGLFFEFEEESGGMITDDSIGVVPQPTAPKTHPKNLEEILREAPGPNLDEIKPTATDEKVNQEVLGQDGEVHFPVIYSLAKLPASPFTAENLLDVLSSLPEDLPIESKRATMKVTLGAMSKTTPGASAESVVADASRKLAALASYTESYSKQAEEYVKLASDDIARLESQISARKKTIEDARERSRKVVEACTAESDRLDDVLEFFSMDQPPSKLAEGKSD